MVPAQTELQGLEPNQQTITSLSRHYHVTYIMCRCLNQWRHVRMVLYSWIPLADLSARFQMVFYFRVKHFERFKCACWIIYTMQKTPHFDATGIQVLNRVIKKFQIESVNANHLNCIPVTEFWRDLPISLDMLPTTKNVHHSYPFLSWRKNSDLKIAFLQHWLLVSYDQFDLDLNKASVSFYILNTRMTLRSK